MKQLCKTFGIILALFAVFLITAPEKGFASQKNVTDEYLQNPELYKGDSTAAGGGAAVGLTPWDYIKMFLALLFVLVLLVWVLKFINKKSIRFQQNNMVRNLGGISLGSQKSVQILQIGDRLYIVGVGENVELIKEISDREEIDKLLSYYNEKQAISTAPPYVIELLKKWKGKSKKEDNNNGDPDFGNLLNQRLSEIQKVRRDNLEKWKEKGHDD